MPLITASHDSLPYIDRPAPPTGPHSLSAARNLIASSLPPSYLTTPHPSLPPLRPSKLTPAAQAEQLRIENKEPLNAIDTTRYELPELAPNTAPTQTQLQQAYASSHYLRGRLQNLALLDQFGKNAWLVGNGQLEDILREVEKELVEVRESVEAINRGRKERQEAGRGEMEGLDQAWRVGVGRVVEVEVEIANLEERRRRMLREGARAGG
ncbi:MAG: hypothetical protein Q9185_002832 [Variospora sp. 1 TL-2023]